MRLCGDVQDVLEDFSNALLAIVKAHGRPIDILIEDVAKLEMGRMPFRPEEMDLAKLARDAVVRYLPLARHRGLELRSEVPAPLLVRADPQKIALVLSHIVNNATKFTNRGGRITIEAERREASAEPRDRGIWVHVTDTGIGIPKEKLPIVFEKFRQADGSATRGYGGTGIGLSLAKSFIEMHGGRMWVESEVGAGSRFTFTAAGPRLDSNSKTSRSAS